MTETIVMTLIGPDRPGLMESVAALLVRHGGNWLESRMSRLGGQFAGILRVELPGEQRQSLLEDLRALNSERLAIVAHADPATTNRDRGTLYQLELTGQDHPGIVRQITGVLASENINVEEFESELSSAAMSGETLFTARATLRPPANCDIEHIKDQLEEIAADLIVDITLAPLAAPK